MNYSVLTSDKQAEGYARVLAHSFGRSDAESASWITRHARSSMRVLGDGEDVAAGMIFIPMGQYFGGRSVPMWGVAAVGVAPEARGRGLATGLMKRSLDEMRGAGVPIAALYAATQRLYREVGYEQAGHRYEVRIPLHRIGMRGGVGTGMEIRPIGQGDRERVRGLYAAVSRGFDGNLDRAEIVWDRIERPPPGRVEPARAFGFYDGAGAMQAYVYLSQQPPAVWAGGRHEVVVHDMVAATGEAGRAVWAFLGGYATMAIDAVWFSGPAHPLLMLLPEQVYRPAFKDHWMVRMVDVGAALEARGYPAHVRASVRLEVEDAVLRENSGVYEVRVEEGRAAVTRELRAGGQGMIRIGVTPLASLYTGFASPWALRSIGQLEGDDGALSAAASIFAGATPWMTDHF